MRHSEMYIGYVGCLSLTAFPHYCMHPDVSCGNGKGLCIIGWICSQCMGFVAVTT